MPGVGDAMPTTHTASSLPSQSRTLEKGESAVDSGARHFGRRLEEGSDKSNVD